jgi:3-oxoacyl-[acyl-carrier-protein] synthase-1
MPGEAIVVTGIGMRSAVGYHAMQTAASVRAGLNRFTEWKHFGVDDGGIVASWIPPDLGDCSWCEKLLDLARTPLAEALWQARLWEFPYLLPCLRRPARIHAFLGPPPSRTSRCYSRGAPGLCGDGR